MHLHTLPHILCSPPREDVCLPGCLQLIEKQAPRSGYIDESTLVKCYEIYCSIIYPFGYLFKISSPPSPPSSLPYDRSIISSKTSSPDRAIKCCPFQISVYSASLRLPSTCLRLLPRLFSPLFFFINMF
jgi:hypothetical protein